MELWHQIIDLYPNFSASITKMLIKEMRYRF